MTRRNLLSVLPWAAACVGRAIAQCTDPANDPSVLRPQTTVPVYVHASHDDKWVDPSDVIASCSLVADATPRKLQLGTGATPETEVLPIFTNFIVNTPEGGPVLSFIEVPTLPFPEPRLCTNHTERSVSVPLDDQRFTIRTDSFFAASFDVSATSLTESSPGTAFPGAVIPLNNPVHVPFMNSIGLLRPAGAANAGITLAGLVLGPAFSGSNISDATVIVSGGFLTSNVVTVSLVP